jgi:hypothetical protein
MPLVVPPATIPRAVVGNRNNPPIYNQNELANAIRNQRIKRTAASNADWRDIRLTYFSFVMAGAEIPLVKGFSFRAAIEYPLGVYYPVTFNGARDVTFADGDARIIQSDPVAGLYLPRAARFYERVRRNFTSLANGNNLITHENDVAFGEWSFSSNDAADYTLGGEPGAGAAGYVNLSGTSIASVNITAGGSGYTGTVNLYAFDPHNGSHTGTLIGTRTVNAGVVLVGFIGSGSLQNAAGPWGPSTTLVIAPNGSLLTDDAWCASLVDGAPDHQTESLVMMGDSIARGYGAGDMVGDESRNYGVYERAIGGRVGTINFAYPGISCNAFLPFSTKFPLCHSAYDPVSTIALVQAGSNDIGAGATGGNTASLMSSIASEWRAKGARVLHTTMPPRTTSTDAWVTAANQTPFTDFQAGKGMEQLNASIKYREGGLAGDLPPIDYYSVAVDPANPYKWRSDGGAHTDDGSHANALIGLRVQSEALAKILPRLT